MRPKLVNKGPRVPIKGSQSSNFGSQNGLSLEEVAINAQKSGTYLPKDQACENSYLQKVCCFFSFPKIILVNRFCFCL